MVAGFSRTTTLSAALALLSLSEALPATQYTPYNNKRDLKFKYNNDKVRGVNIGGWLVTEPWITPSLYEDSNNGANFRDEYSMGESLGKDKAYERLSKHWSSFITEDDFKQIAGAGLNHVRIPVGYWSVLNIDNEPYVNGAYEWLGKSLDWAQGAGLKVMIDLHGAQGSQNGFDNSGRLGNVDWGKGDTVAYTTKVLNKIRDDHANHPAVAAIELLNEPLGPSLDMGTVRQFYQDGWGNLKDSNVAIVFHDAFQGVTSWNDWGSGMSNLMLDTHHYEIFDNGQVAQSIDDHVKTACSFGSQMASNNKWTISGEWTGAITDCAKWLNGAGKGARYDGTFSNAQGGSNKVGSCDGKYTGTVAGLSNDDKNNISRFIEAQLDGYEKAKGWIFWTWKTESAPEWNMKDLLAEGLFPQPLTSRKHAGQCG